MQSRQASCQGTLEWALWVLPARPPVILVKPSHLSAQLNAGGSGIKQLLKVKVSSFSAFITGKGSVTGSRLWSTNCQLLPWRLNHFTQLALAMNSHY